MTYNSLCLSHTPAHHAHAAQGGSGGVHEARGPPPGPQDGRHIRVPHRTPGSDWNEMPHISPASALPQPCLSKTGWRQGEGKKVRKTDRGRRIEGEGEELRQKMKQINREKDRGLLRVCLRSEPGVCLNRARAGVAVATGLPSRGEGTAAAPVKEDNLVVREPGSFITRHTLILSRPPNHVCSKYICR